MADNVRSLPSNQLPPPTGNPFIDEVEASILRNLAESICFAKESSLHQAVGLAEARSRYLRLHDEASPVPHHGSYIATAVILIRRLSDRQQAKLRHPARSREEMQILLEGGSP